MVTLKKALDRLPERIVRQLKSVSKEELNNVQEDKDGRNYDPSLMFRNHAITEGFELTRLFKCYYSGWECDEWAAEGTKDGKKYFISTNHGRLEFEEMK